MSNRAVHFSDWAAKKCLENPDWFAGYLAGFKEAAGIVWHDHPEAGRYLKNFYENIFEKDD